MARSKKSKKSHGRGTPAARTAQPPARRNSGQPAPPPAPAAVPPGLRPARSFGPGLVLEANQHTTLSAPPGLVPVGARDKPAGAEPGTPAAQAPDGLPGWAAKAVEELLTVTYWLDPGVTGQPFDATIRFSGHRAGVTGKPQPRDTFWQEETVEGIVPGSGPVAITAEVRGINPGTWTVTARPVARAGRSQPPAGRNAAGAGRVPWPRRVVIPAGSPATVRTTSLLRSKVPGIIRFAYASLVSLGVLAGLSLEAVLLAGGHYPVSGPLVFSAAAVLAGVIGGKAWYIAAERGRKLDGWCIQGFVVGAAVAVVAAAAWAGPGVPPGVFLSVAAAALLIGMAIGRPGCFWAGCCTGRPTASRRGIWSSDRRVGCRREPAQLLEALASLILGVVVLAVVLSAGLSRSGPVAAAGLAGYTLSRQFILSLRADPPRHWRYGRPATVTVAALVLIASAVLLARA
jgi:phosphatidylglycerol:prolipoprotein diacylglycerol transferase